MFNCQIAIVVGVMLDNFSAFGKLARPFRSDHWRPRTFSVWWQSREHSGEQTFGLPNGPGMDASIQEAIVRISAASTT